MTKHFAFLALATAAVAACEQNRSITHPAAVSAAGLALASRTASGGTLPISLTVHGNVLYVLNGGGSGNISGFTLGASGDLTPIAGATLPLSGSTVGPADVQFSPDGRHLVVTEKNTNLLDVYAVDASGVASGPTTRASAGC